MNWIIRNTKKLRCHTNLTNLLVLDWIDISNYNWCLSDIDIADYVGLPIDFEEDFHLLNPTDFKKIVDSDVQVVWGIISAINKNEQPELNQGNLPFVEGNDEVWKNNYFQVTNSIIEITAWDSSYTIVKFRDAELSRKFESYFTEAIPLEKYKF